MEDISTRETISSRSLRIARGRRARDSTGNSLTRNRTYNIQVSLRDRGRISEDVSEDMTGEVQQARVGIGAELTATLNCISTKVQF